MFSQFCINNGGKLAESLTIEENNEIEFYLANKEMGPDFNSEYWIGLTDQVIKGSFVWTSTGQVANFTNWLNGEPKLENDTDANCAKLSRQIQDRKWNVFSCQQEIALALCQKGLFNIT